MASKKIPEINSTSTADIAFMLLIFFLVTTTMDVDSGITRKLPPPVPDDVEPPPPVKERNVFIVLLNANNQLLVESRLMDVTQLTDATKEFILNPRNNPDLSVCIPLSQKLAKSTSVGDTKGAEKWQRLLSLFGDVRISKGIVSLQNDRGTGYGHYIAVQNELVRAFNELKEDLAQKTWGKKYDDLIEDQQKLIRQIYPLSISEAEPRNIGGK
jgi:biopolymer transport protein ExbD